MHGLTLTLLAATFAFAPSAAAQQAWDRTGAWEILRDPAGCDARLRGAGNSVLTVRWATDGTARMRIDAPVAKNPRKLPPARIVVYGKRADGDEYSVLSLDAAVTASASTLSAETIIPASGKWPVLAGPNIALRAGAKRTLASFVAGAEALTARMLSRCLTEMQRIDRGSGEAMATPGSPLVAVARLITDEDYPVFALRNELTGRSIVKLTVSAKGLVSDCRVHQTSGHEILDSSACLAASRRARFTPALDKVGRPTEASYLLPVTWKMPE